jgi:hypothetical protein
MLSLGRQDDLSCKSDQPSEDGQEGRYVDQNQKRGPTPKNEGNNLGSHLNKSQNEGWGTRCLPHGLRKRQKQIAWRPMATACENPALRPGSPLHYLAATRAVAIELLDGERLSWAHEFFCLAFGFFL